MVSLDKIFQSSKKNQTPINNKLYLIKECFIYTNLFLNLGNKRLFIFIIFKLILIDERFISITTLIRLTNIKFLNKI